MTQPTTQERRFDPTLGAVRAAREFVVDAAGGGDDDLTATLALVTSELASNAVLHARTPFVVRVRSSSESVRIAVFDHDGALPTPREDGLGGVTGRGLAIVGSLASEWGVEQEGAGKWVWADVIRSGHGSGDSD
jgi:anti-sigma regulatory factor (Ser/Thr protein kinase)